jgi:hypothetical protein
MSRNRLFTLLAALALFPAAAHAQGTTTITACYVPKTGSVYRIQAAGAPDVCKNGHVEFSWDSESSVSIGYAVRTGQATLIAALGFANIVAYCSAGEVAVGGGYHINQGALVSTRANRPLADGAGWVVTILNPGDIEYTATPYVTCLALPN